MKGWNCTWLAVLMGASCCLPGVAAAPDAGRPRKLIATGWDKVDQKRLKDYVRQMEQQPFQGVMMSVVGEQPDGRPCGVRNLQTAQPWERTWFEGAIADLKSIEFRQFTDNFVSTGANPGDVDWFDDEGWARVAEHWGIAAWVAKEAGFRGVLFDPEPYTKPHAQFRYGAQAGHEAHTFDEYCRKARERGRQVMGAVVREYPDLTVFCYFMNSVNRHTTTVADPMPLLEAGGYGLFPSFIDGWLDTAPPTVTFVDGCESAYLFNSERQYLRSAVKIKGDCQVLVAPENRAKYRAQVQVSYGVYLDAYWNPADSEWSRWRIDCEDRKPAQQLLRNVRNAVESCDEYVWIYGEKFRWWPTPNGRVFKQDWPQALPGCDLALRLARDATAYARYLLSNAERRGALQDLARNGDFQSAAAPDNQGRQADWTEGGAPAGWSCWQMKPDEGTFAWDRDLGAAKAAGVPESGCFIQSYEAVPGECYAVRARVREQGRTRTWVRARWQTPEGKWTMENRDVTAVPDAPDNNGWAGIFASATVPDGVGKLVLLLGVGGQTTASDAAWFDDVGVYRLADSDTFAKDPVRCDLRQ